MSVALTAPRGACNRALLRRRAGALLRALGLGRAELSVALVDDAEIAALNRRYRRKRGPTDVLSFSLLEGAAQEHRGALLGDVVIGLGVAAQQAKRLRHSLDDEILRLLIHGVLHLVGYDHEAEAEAEVMEARERELWAAVRAR
jgi:rRNA maturation RNase YbeY